VSPVSNLLEENNLEVAVLGLFDMENNEKLQRLLAKQQPKSQKAAAVGASTHQTTECPDVRIHAKLQLPIHPEDPSKPCIWNFSPTDLALAKPGRRISRGAVAGGNGFAYRFDHTDGSCRKRVGLLRKDPKQERTLLRRVETKTLQLSVFYLHNQKTRAEAKAEAERVAAASKKKSWFWGSKSGAKEKEQADESDGEGDPRDLFLGKVTIEFKPLLSRGCITGDFPILVNARPIGGVLRVCLRTRPVLDPDRYEGLPVTGSSPSISLYKEGLSFGFKQDGETNKGEKGMIESIQKESSASKE